MSNYREWVSNRVYVRPLLFAIVAGVVATGVDLAAESDKKFLDAFVTWHTLAIALLAWVLEKLLSWREFAEDYDTLKALKEIVSGFSFPIAEYAKRRIARSVSQIDTDLHNLETDVLGGQTFADKMEIIESLIQDLGNDLTRYWATTLDKPSKMWREADRFFELQDKLLSRVTNKRRIVVLSLKKLREEIEDASDDNALERFIEWHEDKKSNFELLFLIDDKNEFVHSTQKFLERHLKPLHVVTDFAIMGDKWVYGEVATSSDATDENKSLRLYEAKPMGNLPATVVDDYRRFYEALWSRWEGYTWPIMSPKQILSERSRYRVKQVHLEQTRVHYNEMFPSKTAAPDCYESARTFLASCKTGDEIFAVDIAPLKSCLRVWLSTAEYVKWMEATLKAAGNGCGFKRVYVLNQRLSTLADAEEAYDQIFAPQLAAKVDVWLLSAKDLWAQGTPVHDFLLVRKKLCLSLTWDEPFSKDSICVDKNLEHPATFGWYENVFNNIAKSPSAKSLQTVKRDATLDYLASHRW